MFEKGNKLATGRPKGVPNKLSLCAKANIETTFERMGGIDAFVEWATLNKGDFYKLIYSKIIPRAVELGNTESGTLSITWGTPDIKKLPSGITEVVEGDQLDLREENENQKAV